MKTMLLIGLAILAISCGKSPQTNSQLSEMTDLFRAGGKDGGNGGGAHVCGTDVQMYDLFEAEFRYLLTPYSKGQTVDDYLTRALSKIHGKNSEVHKKILNALSYLKDHLVIKEGINLTPIHDANILLTGTGCSYQQLANWDEFSGNIFVQKSLFDHLRPRDIAAFFLHEARYKVGRDFYGESTSDLTRKIVGDAFAVNETMFFDPGYGNYIEVNNANVGFSVMPFHNESQTARIVYRPKQKRMKGKITYKLAVYWNGLEGLKKELASVTDEREREGYQELINILLNARVPKEIERYNPALGQDNNWVFEDSNLTFTHCIQTPQNFNDGVDDTGEFVITAEDKSSNNALLSRISQKFVKTPYRFCISSRDDVPSP